MKIPKFTQPLEKGIRTSEGILTTVVSTLIAVMSLVDPSSLPRKEGAIVIAGLSGLYAIQRGLVKAVAIQNGIGIAAPIDDTKVDALGAKVEFYAKKLDSLAGALPLLKQVERATYPVVSTSAADTVASDPVPADPLEAAVDALTPEQEAEVQPPLIDNQVVKPESAYKPDPPVSVSSTASATTPSVPSVQS